MAAAASAGKTTDKDREESARTTGEEDEVPSRQEIRWRRKGGGGDFPYPLKYGGTGKGKWRRESRVYRAIRPKMRRTGSSRDRIATLPINA